MTTLPPSMAAALDRLWDKFLPEIEQRLEIVECAARARAAGTLQTEEREAAHQAAHKLAGILGTFGLPRGTELARQAEEQMALGHGSHEDKSPSSELLACAGELRSVIEHRK